ncbi:MAG: hypothetical protein FJW40_22010 [Acidobacteria bacterium]|nr:hypothetical protein [Acidobacteriota bacterium]
MPRTWRDRILVLALLLSPAAYWISLRHAGERRDGFRIVQVDAAKRAAHKFAAAELDCDCEDWNAIARINIDSSLGAYYAGKSEIPEFARQFAPVAVVSVVLASPDETEWIEVLLGSEGDVLGFRDGRMPDMPGGPPPPENEMRSLAQSHLDEYLADTHFELHGPEFATGAGPHGMAVGRFTWTDEEDALPELTVRFSVSVRAGRVVERVPAAELSAAYQAGAVRRSDQFINFLRLSILAVGVVAACFRFARRAMEQEVSYGRSILILGVVFGVGAAQLWLNPYLALGGASAEALLDASLIASAVPVLVTVLVQAIFGSLAYGAGESDLRERLQGSLTSMDSMLLGRPFTRPVGRGVLSGLGVAGWVALAASLVSGFGPEPEVAQFAGRLASQYATPSGILVLPMFLLAGGLYATAGWMLPAILGRRIRNPWLWWALLASFCILGGSLAQGGNFLTLQSVERTLAMAAALMAAYWLRDFLAAIVAVMALMFRATWVDIGPVLNGWDESMTTGFWFSVALAAPFAWAWLRGRAISQEEVMPVSAANLARRRALQSEVSAAREAQLRLLPGESPRLAGIEWAASCTAAREVSGDFYDFYPAEGGKLTVLVADGGSGGLASALTIAMAKGFMAYAARRAWRPALALDRLLDALGDSVGRRRDQFSLVYLTVDPARGLVEYARLGGLTRILVTGPGGMRELTGSALRHGGEVFEGTLSMGPAEVLTIATDGLFQHFEAGRGVPLMEWRPAAALSAESLHRDLTAQLGELRDDVTVVAIRLRGAQAQTLEGVA